MKPMNRWTIFAAATTAGLLGASPVSAQEPVTSGGLVIEEAWARATPPGASSAAAYVIIMNRATVADRLVGVESPLAASASMHLTKLDGGIARMTPMPNGIELPPATELMMMPGGMHVMLTGLNQALTQGERLPIVLTFGDGRQVRIDAEVKRIGAEAPEHQHSGT